MSGVDTRTISRDSLFLMGDVQIRGDATVHKVKVRNLSAGGMMAEGGPDVERGALISVVLRNAGRVDGIVAWVENARFGIAFATEIDPKIVRAHAPPADDAMPPRFVRTVGVNSRPAAVDPQRMRKI
ncbi:MAG: PilZ domain-containing protein [Pontixanthobacter sp.]